MNFFKSSIRFLIFRNRKINLCFCVLLFIFSANGADPVKGIFGVNISAGAMNYKGDLDQNLSLHFTRSGFGLHLETLPFSNFNFSLNYLHGNIECDDSKSDLPGNKYRNLSFYSAINELSLNVIFRMQKKPKSFTDRTKLVPYLFAGIGFFHFNPKRNVNGAVYELQKIGTEGQHLSNASSVISYPQPYKLWQFNIPFGGGVKIRIEKQFDLSLETGLRKTFTDYIDDVSGYYPDKEELIYEEGNTAGLLSDPSNDPKRVNGRDSFSRRGDADKKDWFVYTNIGVTYYFTWKYLPAKQKFTAPAVQ